MSIDIPMPEFDQLADIFWRLGVMQSPSQLHGYLLGRLVAGDELDASQWLTLAAAYIDAVEPPNEYESTVLMAFYQSTGASLVSEDMVLALFLPDDAAEIPLRVDSIGQWCQGFLAGFAAAGKVIMSVRGPQEYSAEVSEALTDMAAISQVSLGDDDISVEQSEQDIFELVEYLRLAAITLYMECNKKPNAPAVTESVTNTKTGASLDESALGSPNNLFANTSKKLH